ncbi:MAG: methyltransferase domain-containing protein [Anaerolineaceae bacterium]|nr:methyltransferase domain-containing protein [Anaerolineaceae bacterium]MDD4042361.1 methyltransferase domain-containing protein [Anaerolineaceae bacterium]MDD4577401.1 methyltransferase domain-containing protein [Anaerolineaceae bacterium]
MDNTQKFSGKATVYRQSRPSYSPEMFTYLQQVFGLKKGSVVADVGSGTGILSQQLLELGARVFAVEPNEDMRLVAEQDLGKNKNYISVDATAEQTTLPENSLDFVFAASAFHWFDPVVFKHECERILKPGGKVFLIWNEPQTLEEIQQARRAIYEKYAPKFIGFSGGHKENPGVKEKFFDGKLKEVHFANPITYDKEKFIGRALSSSYALNESDERYDEFVAELGALFDRFAVDGVIHEAQETVMYFKADSL